MPFNASNDPQKWQDLYTEKQAHFDSLGKVSRVLIPSLLLLTIPFLFLILHSTRAFESGLNPYLSIAISLFLILAPLIFIGIGVGHLFNSAAIFLAKFHDLPDALPISAGGAEAS